MIRVLSYCFAFLFLASCATKVTPPTDQRVPAQNQVSVPDSSDITVWTLQDLARDKKYDVLNELFVNRGLAQSSIRNSKY